EHFERCRVLAIEIGNRMMSQIASMFTGMARAAIDPNTAALATLDAAVALEEDGSHLQAAMALTRVALAVDELGQPELAASVCGATHAVDLTARVMLVQGFGASRLLEAQRLFPEAVERGRGWSLRDAAEAARVALSVESAS